MFKFGFHHLHNHLHINLYIHVCPMSYVDTHHFSMRTQHTSSLGDLPVFGDVPDTFIGSALQLFYLPPPDGQHR